MRDLSLHHIIRRDLGTELFEEFNSYLIQDAELIIEIAKAILESIPATFGSCVMVSAGFTAALRSQGIPSVVILGDLIIEGKYAFKCSGNLPRPRYEAEIINKKWDGHAWVVIGELIFDLSVFRSAYALQHPSHLKTYVLKHFGSGKGAIMSTAENLPSGIKFVPHHALDDEQIFCILEGLPLQSRS